MNETQVSQAQPVVMIVISAVGSVISFGLSVLLARYLGADDFQNYAVAISTLTLVATICEFGTGKFALKAVPEYASRSEYSLLAGYTYFSLLLVLGLSLAIGAVMIGLGSGAPDVYDNEGMVWALYFLPVTALVSVAAEFVMANRKPVAGSAITRLLCPALTLLGVLSVVAFQGQLRLHAALMAFGIAGLIGMVVAGFLLLRTKLARSVSYRARFEWLYWLRQCFWFSSLAILSSWLFRISVLVLHAFDIDELEVARFAAAMETAGFILLVAKSTNKYYQPELSLIMAQKKWDRLLEMRDARRWLMRVICGSYFLLMVLTGRMILSWFGDDFVAGYPALLWLSAGTCVATYFAMAPEFLKFVNRMRAVLLVNLVGGVALVLTTGWLASRYGATGAGAAFGGTLIIMSIVYRRIATPEFEHLILRNQPEHEPL